MNQSYIHQIPQYPIQQQVYQQNNHPQVQFQQQNQKQNQVLNGNYIEYQGNGQNKENFVYIATIPATIEPEDMNCIIPSTSELGGLYLGGLDAAMDVELLKKYKIRAVLTASVETPLQYSQDIVHFHLSLQAHDKDNYDISQHFDQAIEFIDSHRKYTSVFVHCYAGVSRSAACVIAYLMKVYKWQLEKCLWFCRQKRRFVRPNPGFMKQLIEYEKELFGFSSLSTKRQQLLTQPYPVQPQQVQQVNYNEPKYEQTQQPQRGGYQYQQTGQPVQKQQNNPYGQQLVY